MKPGFPLFLLVLVVIGFVPLAGRTEGLRVGSKKFTESVVLGEIATLLARSAGVELTHQRELG